MRLLLDTCALIWLASDQSKLSDAAAAAIADRSHTLFVSPISGFEIALKVRKLRLVLPLPPRAWLQHAVQSFALREAELTLMVAAHAAEMPLEHGDPADRILIATAYALGAAIVTPDRAIRDCGEVSVIW